VDGTGLGSCSVAGFGTSSVVNLLVLLPNRFSHYTAYNQNTAAESPCAVQMSVGGSRPTPWHRIFLEKLTVTLTVQPINQKAN
jgi:hypothetical protein